MFVMKTSPFKSTLIFNGRLRYDARRRPCHVYDVISDLWRNSRTRRRRSRRGLHSKRYISFYQNFDNTYKCINSISLFRFVFFVRKVGAVVAGRGVPRGGSMKEERELGRKGLFSGIRVKKGICLDEGWDGCYKGRFLMGERMKGLV